MVSKHTQTILNRFQQDFEQETFHMKFHFMKFIIEETSFSRELCQGSAEKIAKMKEHRPMMFTQQEVEFQSYESDFFFDMRFELNKKIHKFGHVESFNIE
mmetsp:Transcript_3758/g.5686  ORF Transcript_3758/g.5686 Transcript_3758/m.5686 type:complete len:100 (+) Transcript_3758:1112-1411(+)